MRTSESAGARGAALLLLAPLLLLSGCEASYSSSRTAATTPDSAAVDQSGGASDSSGATDSGGTSDGAAVGDGSIASDGGGRPDQGISPDKGASGPRTLAQGKWTGRTGHLGEGSASLVRLANGTIELRFGADFRTSAVPGPVVVLSSRSALGSSIDKSKGDLDLGVLKSASGAQTYVLPGGDGGRRYAWVFCEPFGLEISRVQLVNVP